MNDYLDVTELAGDDVSLEQVQRCSNRYYWAGNYCNNKDVVEVACGTGPGLGYLLEKAKTLVASDISEPILQIARNHYKDRLNLEEFDACNMPFERESKDVIIIFEAIYYLPDFKKFINECSRVLRPGGLILIATANKDLIDFNPSPYTYRYYGVSELNNIFLENGFHADFFGYLDVKKVSIKQKILRPIKKIVVKLNLMPKTMQGKKILKALVFGSLVKFPFEIDEDEIDRSDPEPLIASEVNTKHKVIYCVAAKV
jgi:SAM-dependent methyltransferase